MTAKTMAEVLAEHRISAHFTCECGEDFYPDEEDLDEERADEPDGFIKAYESHQAAALSAAGFGLVADAGAKALEDAADEADKTSANIINNNINLYPAWDGMAEGWKNAATRLRARAAAVRGDV